MKRNDLEFYDQTAEQWWNQDAKIYALHHLNPPRFQYFDRHVPTWQGLKVLDVGCGGGFSCEFLARQGAIVSGIDQSRACILTAQAHAESCNLEIEYQHGFAEQLPYDSETFDVMVCVDVLEHVTDVRQTIAEIHRALKPGGLFLFDTINRTFKSKLLLIWLLENVLREIPQGIHDWHKFIKPEELKHFLKQVGFNSIEIKGFNVFGNSLSETISTYLHYRKTKGLRVSISENTSTMYIGKAIKF